MEFEEDTDVLYLSEVMKVIPRTGWHLAGIGTERGESIAAHSWGTSFIAFLLINALDNDDASRIDVAKVLTMAILHDLPESVISDIPRRSEGKEWEQLREIKDELEAQTISRIFGTDPNREEIVDLWTEYHEGESIEARIVRAADILDMLNHAQALEEQGVSPSRLVQFFVSGMKRLESLKIEPAMTMAQELMRLHSRKTTETS